jgi:signal transduction histidine kinase
MSINKTSLVLVFLLFCFVKLSAQSTDEPLLDWYRNSFLTPKTSVEQALEINNEKLVEAEAIQDVTTAARLHTEIGIANLAHVHDYQKAMDHFIEAVAIEDSLELTDEKIISFIAIAQVFEAVNDNYKSAEYLEQALEHNYPTENYNTHIYILNKLGTINASIGKIEEATANYEQVLLYKDKVDDARVEGTALFNMAYLLMLEKKYDEALDKHKDALRVRRSVGDKQGEAQSLNDIGELYWLMKNEERSLANHRASLEIRQVLKDKHGLTESYNNIGILYHHQKNYEKANENFLLALESGQELQDQSELLQTFEYLSNGYKALNNYQLALTYNERFVALNELFFREKEAQQILEKQNRYIIDQKESQIEKLETIRKQSAREIADQRKLQNFLFGIIGLAVVIVVLIFGMYILKRRSNRSLKIANEKVQEQNLQLQELNATKDKFFSIISHDLKGPLNSFTSFSGLLINHTDSLSKDEIRMLAKDLDKSLKNLFDLLENLLEWSRSQTGSIEFKPEKFNLNLLLEGNKQLLEAQAQNKKIGLVNANQMELPVSAHKHSVNTVVRNLISNAIKFTPEGGTITLNAQQKGQETIISIADNGVGMSRDIMDKLFRIDTKHSTKGTANEKGTGLGLILCKEFIEKNGGRIWVNSEVGKGSVFYFAVPSAAVGELIST